MTIPHGTADVLAYIEHLPQRAENLRSFFDHRAAAIDLLICKEIIERLAPLESDLEAELGDN